MFKINTVTEFSHDLTVTRNEVDLLTIRVDGLKPGHNTSNVIRLIDASFDHENDVEILTSDELFATAMKILDVTNAKIRQETRAATIRLMIKTLMNEGRAKTRPVNFTVGRRGRKAKVETTSAPASTSSVEVSDVAPSNNDATTTDAEHVVTPVKTARPRVNGRFVKAA